jgi:hypothetical protein
MSVELLTLSNDWVPAQKKKHTRKGTNVMNETKATGRLGQFLARKNIIKKSNDFVRNNFFAYHSFGFRHYIIRVKYRTVF